MTLHARCIVALADARRTGFFHGINPAMGWLFEFWRPLLSFELRERCRLFGPLRQITI
jgi:hypothetical protein